MSTRTVNPQQVLARAIRIIEAHVKFDGSLSASEAATIERCLANLVDLSRSMPSKLQLLPDAPPLHQARKPANLVDEFVAKGGRIETDAVRAQRQFKEKYGDEAAALLSTIKLTF